MVVNWQDYSSLSSDEFYRLRKGFKKLHCGSNRSWRKSRLRGREQRRQRKLLKRDPVKKFKKSGKVWRRHNWKQQNYANELKVVDVLFCGLSVLTPVWSVFSWEIPLDEFFLPRSFLVHAHIKTLVTCNYINRWVSQSRIRDFSCHSSDNLNAGLIKGLSSYFNTLYLSNLGTICIISRSIDVIYVVSISYLYNMSWNRKKLKKLSSYLQ